MTFVMAEPTDEMGMTNLVCDGLGDCYGFYWQTIHFPSHLRRGITLKIVIGPKLIVPMNPLLKLGANLAGDSLRDCSEWS